MDKSQVYINMCKAAPEIQALAPTAQTQIHLWGNIYSYSTKDDTAFFWRMNTYKDDILDYTIAVWLPRQDQLQDMVINNPRTGLLNMSFFFADFFYDVSTDNNGDPLDSLKFTSMEQLWLAFVMQEKYNKSWEEGDWHDIKN